MSRSEAVAYRFRLFHSATPIALCGLLVFATLVAVFDANAQVLYGSLTGNVSDPTGAAVTNATVEALNMATGISKHAATDAHGLYLITDLQPGPYKITIRATGFAELVQTGIELKENSVVRTDARLQVARQNEIVTVASTTEALQTDRADVNTQLSSTQVANLPSTSSTGRNFESLFRIVPGFTPPAEQNSAAGNPQRSMATNVNGVSDVNNYVQLDGANVQYTWLPYIIAYVPPVEAIETVNMVTNSFNAEQGLAGGSSINVAIKSGTNQFHGAAWEYNTNTDFNARSYFYYGGSVPKNILNQFGASLGGPIKKNKLFFFMDWERTMQREAISGLLTVPTTNLIQGNFGGTSATIYNPYTGNPNGTGRVPFAGNVIPSTYFDPAAAKMASLIPAPNQNVSGIANNYFGADDYSFTRDSADVKVNYNPTDNSSVFGRYSISPDTIVDPFQLGAAEGGTWDGGQPGTAFGTIQSGAVGGTYTFAPNVLLDGNAGYTRQRVGAEATDINGNYGLDVLHIPGTNGSNKLQGGIPYFDITSGSGTNFAPLGNSNTGNPFLFRDNNYTGAVNLGWVKGAHALRFGWNYIHGAMNHFQPQGGTFQTARGSFQFTGGLTTLNAKGAPAANLYNAWADFLLGLPTQEGKAIQNIDPNSVRMSSYGYYAQDTWQVSRNLTLTYGLRYEYYPFATRDHYGSFRFDPTTGLVLIGGQGGVPEDTGEYVSWANFAPRLGIAYRLGQKTVVRAGAGITIDPDNFRDMRNTYPAIINTSYPGASSYQAAATLTGYAPPGLTPLSPLTGLPTPAPINLSSGKIPLPTNVGDETVPNPYRRGQIQSYNFTIQRELAWGFVAQAGYVGTHEVRQMSNVNINASYPGGGTAGRLLYGLYGLTADINAAEPFGTSRYNSLQTQLTRRVGSAQIGMSYVYSKAMDYADNSTYNGLTFAYPTYWQRNWALAGYDRTHNFELWSVYELPFGPGKKFASQGIVSRIVGGWQLNAILTRASGLPFTVTSSSTPCNCPGNTEVASQVLPSVQILGGHGSGDPYFNTAAYAPVTTAVFGNSGRNSLRGPGLFDLDLGVFRTFDLTERFKLQFRAESFAITNTAQFANPSVLSVGNSGFGNITSVNGGNRTIRLGMRFSF
ncbi:MAG: TonB-dependent receptor [Bryobacteraceae bacterium]